MGSSPEWVSHTVTSAVHLGVRPLGGGSGARVEGYVSHAPTKLKRGCAVHRYQSVYGIRDACVYECFASTVEDVEADLRAWAAAKLMRGEYLRTEQESTSGGIPLVELHDWYGDDE